MLSYENALAALVAATAEPFGHSTYSGGKSFLDYLRARVPAQVVNICRGSASDSDQSTVCSITILRYFAHRSFSQIDSKELTFEELGLGAEVLRWEDASAFRYPIQGLCGFIYLQMRLAFCAFGYDAQRINSIDGDIDIFQYLNSDIDSYLNSHINTRVIVVDLDKRLAQDAAYKFLYEDAADNYLIFMIDWALLISDCGTYLYTASPYEFNYFRAAAQLSTLLFDRAKINLFFRPNCLWALSIDARRKRRTWSTDSSLTCWRGGHDGVARLPDQVHLTREMVLEHVNGRLQLKYSFEVKAPHLIRTTFYAAPGGRVEVQKDSAVFHAKRRRFKMRWTGSNNSRARKLSGRVSPLYGYARAIEVLEFLTEDLPVAPLRGTLEEIL